MLMSMVVVMKMVLTPASLSLRAKQYKKPNNLSASPDSATCYLVSWGDLPVSLNLSSLISEGRMILSAFLGCLGIRGPGPVNARDLLETMEDIKLQSTECVLAVQTSPRVHRM